MTDTVRLKDIIAKCKINCKDIAGKMGLPYHVLRRKIEGRSEFVASEIDMLCSLLGICEADAREGIFLLKIVI